MKADVDLAVVGMACRFPGAASTTELADLLQNGRIATGSIPEARRKLWGMADVVPVTAGLLDGIEFFDRHPFRISANEAPWIDPQQRLALEVAWQAFEDAGLSPGCLDGLSAGVFMGAASSEHAIRLAQLGPVRGNPYLANSVQNAAISGRVSYCFGLNGPSMTVDGACSSALLALSLAGDALRLGQCDIALAGGTNALLAPMGFDVLRLAGVLSPSGQMRSFDARADGYVRSEGCGILILKRLRDAEVLGDRIHAVLPGWSIWQDSKRNGLSAPSPLAQEQVISTAIQSAGLTPCEVGAIEAHGTATALGDSIEAIALSKAFSARTSAAAALGAIKAAVGHLEAASGIASVIKAILMVRDGFIPAQPHFDDPSPRIDWQGLPFAMPRETRQWLEPRRIVGVNSFSMSGLCAHILVSSWHGTPRQPPPGPLSYCEQHMFLLSAATAGALGARAKQLLAELMKPEASLQDLAAAVSRRWVGLSYRAGFLAASREEAIRALEQIMSGPPLRPTPPVKPLAIEGLADLTPDEYALVCGACPDIAPKESGPAAAQHVRDHPLTDRVSPVLLALHLAGADIRPEAIWPQGAGTPALPGYPFDRELSWYDAAKRDV